MAAEEIRRTVSSALSRPRVPSLPRDHKPMESPVPPYEPFPVDVLPGAMRMFVCEAADSLGVDPSFIALPALAACAACIGSTRRIRLNGDWTEPSVFWTCFVAKSGQIKSPAQDLALQTLRKKQDVAFVEYGLAMADFKNATAKWKAEMADWKQSGRERGEPQPNMPAEPRCERFIVQDVTIESLAPILQGTPRGVLLARDELAAWIGGFDLYRSKTGNDMRCWEELHGARTITVDRKTGSDRLIYVPNAAVSVCGTIQPRTLARIMTPQFYESEFAARLLLAMPPAREKSWRDSCVSTRALTGFRDLIRRLLCLEHDLDAQNRPMPRDVNLTDSGRQAWKVFYNEFAEKQADAAGDDDLAAVYAKIEGAAARLTLVLHLMVHPDLPVDAESIRAGTRLAKWFAYEAERIYAFFDQTEGDRERADLIDYIRVHGGRITVRELQRGPRRFRGSVVEIRERLDALARAGIGQWEFEQPEPTGGRPVEFLRLFAVVTPSGTTPGDRTHGE